MADKKEYYEFLHAYSLGCLDEEDLVKLKSYLASETDFPWQELGEFQNLSSLLPSILPIEKPAKEVKDTVARKLYRIKSEIKAKRDRLKQDVRLDADTPVAAKRDKEVLEKIEESKKNVAGDFEPVAPLRKSADLFNTAQTEKRKETKTNAEDEIDTLSDIDEENTTAAGESKKKSSYLEKKHSKKSGGKGKSRFISVLVMIIVIIGIALVYLKVNGDVKKYNSEINSLNKQLNNLSGKINQNGELQLILTSKDLRAINLEPAGDAKDVFGKLFLSPEISKGYIQVSNLPAPDGKEVYQLWIEINRKYYSLSTFSSAEKFPYVTFELPNIVNERKITFELTKEPVGGSEQPGKVIILGGSL